MAVGKRGQYVQFPLLFGDGVDTKDGVYIERLPVNLLAVMFGFRGSSGYLRTFPGLTQKQDVDGLSRGVHWNTVKNEPYRVMGNSLYLGRDVVDSVAGLDRTPMAHSTTSQAVVYENQLVMYKYAGGREAFQNWKSSDDYNGGAADPTSFDWGDIVDVCHLRQRYIFCSKDSDLFWVSDLFNECRPDAVAPAYRAESMPDGIVAIRAWRDYVIAFGTATVEYWALTGDADQIYQVQQSYTTQAGTFGPHTVCQYADSFAMITTPACGIVTIGYLNPGGASWEDLASNTIRRILSGYTQDELKTAVLEQLRYEDHQLLLVHLPDRVLVYDHTASTANGKRVWSVLKSGLQNGLYTAIDFCNEGNVITCGDRKSPIAGVLDPTTSNQYDEPQEIVCWTKIADLSDAMLNDFEIDPGTMPGLNQAQTIWIAATEDGATYYGEKVIEYNRPQQWLKRSLIQKVGRVRYGIGFRIRAVGAAPCNIALARARVS
ncbi:head closure Hc3 [Escherichia phage Skarpretter]|uniref:DNA stabilization protein n=1 Tax=Escherichia phage Skarpretter TaxID=2488654 RepID=A0A3G8F3D6_9CAUD|nr:head closure Hc3 [Escherichia phage Skarpretter]AZF88658.1 DNA stabilization protein [Escherichia phage Skarpretter]